MPSITRLLLEHTSAFSGHNRTRMSRSVCSGGLALLILLSLSVNGCGTAIQLAAEESTTEAADDLPGRIPIKAFAFLPLMDATKLSPSGEHVAFINNTNDGTAFLVVTTYDGKDRKVLFQCDNTQFYIRWFRWVNDERLLISVIVEDVRDTGAGFRQWTQTRLIAINRDGSQLKKDLISPDYNGRGTVIPQLQDNVIGMIPDDPRSVLIALDLTYPTYPDVYKLDVYTGQRILIERSTHGIRNWMADRQGVVRVGTAIDGTTVHILGKPQGQESWQTLIKYDALRESGFDPLGFDEDPNALFIRQAFNGRAAVYRMNLSRPQEPPVLVASHPKYDMGGLIYSTWLKKPVGVYFEAEQSAGIYWAADAKALHTGINAALPHRANYIASSSQDGRRHIVTSSHATQPTQWYLLDEHYRLTRMADSYPELNPKDLVAPTPIVFKARDGALLHGYLTSPSKKPAPLILFPHGGPTARDVLEFDYWTQFFVSRGWAVLQVNFRGSSGYGTEFMEAGFKHWGLEMQDDLTDSVHYAVEHHIADPQRVCIVGGSYGGYAALMGIVKTPDLYRCAVSFAGPSDLRALLRENRDNLYYELGWERQLGYWWGDRDRLKATSPVNHADKVRTPLLLVHGAEDRVVSVEQSRDMAEALADAGFKQFRYVELPHGNHHLSRQEDRVRFFREMERFLSTHLQGAGAATDLQSIR